MMKTRKKGIRSLAILLVLVLTLGFSPVTNVEAKAAPRLNYKKVTLVQGKRKKLKVRNLRRRRKVKWYSTKKSVATVNKKGVVKAKKKGKTYIVAKVGKKKYRCKVIVKKKVTKKKKKTKKTKKSNKKAKISKNIKKQLPVDGCYVSFGFPDSINVNSSVDLFYYLMVGSDNLSNTSYSVRSKYYKWYSSNTNVLKINRYGVATSKSKGISKVYCKYMTKSGKWKKTRIESIKVIDVGDVTFSYSLNFDKEKHLQEVPHFTGFKDNKHHYNYITLTVRNDSDSTIELNKQLDVSAVAMIWFGFVTSDRKPVQIPAHTTRAINYYIYSEFDTIYDEYIPNYVVLDEESTDRISPTYKKDGKKYYPCYNYYDHSWTY